MYIFTWIIKDMLIPVLVGIVTILLTLYINKKRDIAVLLLVHSEHGTATNGEWNIENGESILKGYYKKQRDLDNQFITYLKSIGYENDFHTQKVLNDILKLYRSGAYKKPSDRFDTRSKKQLCDLIRKHKFNTEFLMHIKRYEAYQNNSKWYIKITNVGKTNANEFKIEEFSESKSESITYTGTLKVNESKTIWLYYFDNLLRVNTFHRSYQTKFTYGFLNKKQNIIYLVKKSKYNKKDERIFKITFNDCFAKKREYYCCSKIESKKIN